MILYCFNPLKLSASLVRPQEKMLNVFLLPNLSYFGLMMQRELSSGLCLMSMRSNEGRQLSRMMQWRKERRCYFSEWGFCLGFRKWTLFKLYLYCNLSKIGGIFSSSKFIGQKSMLWLGLEEELAEKTTKYPVMKQLPVQSKFEVK